VEQLLTYKRLKSPEPWYPRRRLVSLYYDQKLNLWQGCTTYWKRWATKKSETKVECHKDDFQHEDRGAEWRENWGAEWWIEPSGVRSGEGCPLPSRLVGLGERHELPQWGPEPQPETHCGRIFWLIEHVWQTALSQNLHFFWDDAAGRGRHVHPWSMSSEYILKNVFNGGTSSCRLHIILKLWWCDVLCSCWVWKHGMWCFGVTFEM